MSTCDRIEELRDYAFDELPSNARRSVEQHLGVCPDCVAELDRLQLTTAALRILPDQENAAAYRVCVRQSVPEPVRFVVVRPCEVRGWGLLRPVCWLRRLWSLRIIAPQ